MSPTIRSRVLRLTPALLGLLLSVIPPGPAMSDPPAGERNLAIAVLDLEPGSPELKGTANHMTELLISRLSTRPNLILVERQRLGDVLSEIELGLSGTVRAETAAAVGRLIGAKALVTGRLFSSGDNVVVVARMIGTETGRV